MVLSKGCNWSGVMSTLYRNIYWFLTQHCYEKVNVVRFNTCDKST